MLRIVHTSDWHLGCPFRQFRPLERQRLQRARFIALEEVFGEAHRAQAHAVLAAGDLFDDPSPAEAVWQGLVRVLESFGETCPVVLLPGNHDPLVEGSVWQPSHPFRRALPGFVHVVDRDDFVLELAEGATVHARPTRSRTSSSDPLRALPVRAPDDEGIRIGLAHGQTFRWDDQDARHPIDLGAARDLGFDYLALGDTHGFRDLTPGEHPAIVYSGTPEQTKFGEREAGHVALVHIRRRTRRPRVEKRPVGTLRWAERDIRTSDDLRALLEEDLHDVVLSLEVSGRFDPAERDALDRQLESLEGTDDVPGRAAAIKMNRKDELDPTSLDDLLREAPDELREAAKLLKEKRATGEVQPAVADRAIAQLYRIARRVG